MTITREQVADLREGDVVELAGGNLRGATVRGPVFREHNGWLLVGPDQVVRDPDGAPSSDSRRTLTVVSRAPRPLYVNHPRTEPVPGDVVRDAEVLAPAGVWLRPWDNGAWIYADGGTRHLNSELPTCLRLLVDGETGQVVPS